MRRESPAYATLFSTGLFVAGIVTGAVTGRAAVARAQDPYAHLDLFARVLTTIEQDYIDQVSSDELVEAAIRGMIGRLDHQSRWLDSEQLESLRDDAEGTTTGIGIEVATDGEGVHIVKVEPDSPAARDGLAAGDKILEVDGQALAGLDPDAIRERFDGDRGQAAELTVIRPGWQSPQTIQTVRDKVHRDSVTGALLAARIAYVRLAQFQEGAADDLEAEVEHLAKPVGGVGALGGLILDLRDDPGGLLSEAVAVSDLFLDQGPIVSTRGRDGAHEEIHRATVGGFPPELKVVVLVNGMSASASEIVAGALQDTHRAELVGEHTYGKGTVQQVYLHATPEDAALKLTVGRYYTPSGQPVAPETGRLPDHVVPYPRPLTAADRLRAEIASLQVDEAERTELLGLVDEAVPAQDPPRAHIPWDEPVAQRADSDPQLQAALALL
jgi:carboxyl-terminal processing protease